MIGVDTVNKALDVPPEECFKTVIMIKKNIGDNPNELFQQCKSTVDHEFHLVGVYTGKFDGPKEVTVKDVQYIRSTEWQFYNKSQSDYMPITYVATKSKIHNFCFIIVQ